MQILNIIYGRKALHSVLLSLLFLVFSFCASTSVVSAASSFTVLTIDSDHIDSELSDFPVFVDLSDMPSDFWNNVTSSGGDIRIYDAAISELPYELVSFDKASSTGSLFFKASTLSSSYNSKFIIHYGDSNKTAHSSSDTYGSENVWKDSYKAVLHLEESPTGTFYDSTSYSNDGTATGTMTVADSVAGAIAGRGIEFDGVDDRITINHSASLDWEYNNSFSVYGWVKTGLGNSNYLGLLGKTGSDNKGWLCHGSNIGGTADSQYLHIRNSGTYEIRVKPTTDQGLDDSEWHLVHCTYDGSGQASGVSLYGDGQAPTLSISENTLESHSITNTNPVIVGFNGNLGDYTEETFDELRMTTDELSGEWIAAEYLNMSSTSAFYTISSF